jgi:hypothetical protein
MVMLTDSGTDYKPLPAGNYAATCIRVIDLGTQTTNYQGEEKSARKVRIFWEIPEETVEWEGQVRPATISSTYTASLHEKANLRKVLESWRGRSFTPDELKGFDTKNVLGAPCLLNVVHTEKDGRTYANVAGVTPLIKGMAKPEITGPLINFDLDAFEPDVLDGLHDKLREQIKASPEYRALTTGEAGFSGHATDEGVANGAGDYDPENEIPF